MGKDGGGSEQMEDDTGVAAQDGQVGILVLGLVYAIRKGVVRWE